MPPSAAVVAPLAVVVTLLLSGVAKWREIQSTRSVIVLLRLPKVLQSRWVAWALPVGEVVLALVLLQPWLPLFRVGAEVAVLLFLAYWVVVARALRFDPRPSCGCFGRIGDQTIRPRTLVRNTVLVALAAVTLWLAVRGDTTWSVLRDGGSTTAWWLVGAVAVATLAVLIGGSPVGDSGRPSSPPPAAAEATGEDYVRRPIPEALLVAPSGSVMTLAEMVRERAQLLVATNCTCGSTGATVEAMGRWRGTLPRLGVRYVSAGVPLERMSEVFAGLPDDALYDHQGLAWKTLGMQGSPSAVLLGADGLLAGGPVTGLEQIEDFVAEIAEALAAEPEPTGETEAQDLPVSDQASSDSSPLPPSESTQTSLASSS